MTWRIDDPQGDEASKVKYDIVQYTRGIVLDLGCGPHKAFPHFLGIDNQVDTALFGIAMQPDVTVPDCANLDDAVNDDSVDAIFSSHLLEHIADYRAALANWWRKIKVGGYLVLYLPHKALYPNRGQHGANPDHKHDFLPVDIERAMQAHDFGFELLVNEDRAARNEYSFLQVYQKRADRTRHYPCRDQQPDLTVCISRFGGFGDMLQMANLLPEFKRLGYHVTVNTTPKGQDILRLDPHIDAWLIVDDNQVPNPELPLFWEAQARRFTRFVQLSESIEGTLLAMPGRANHGWPHSVRAVELNKNYLEWTSMLAEIDYHSEAQFYPSPDETAAIAAQLRQIRADHNRRMAGRDLYIGEQSQPVFVLQWVLAGSSAHKFTPWQDAVIARVLLEWPDAVVLFSGDEACQILEAGWEYEPRVIALSGKQSIRETMTLAQQVDCVVGPETGVLNGVAFAPVPKVLLLSHSSYENLPKHWINCAALVPQGQHCYPCHRLHPSSYFCDTDPATGAAMCQVKIAPEEIYLAIREAYLAWKETAHATARPAHAVPL